MPLLYSKNSSVVPIIKPQRTYLYFEQYSWCFFSAVSQVTLYGWASHTGSPVSTGPGPVARLLGFSRSPGPPSRLDTSASVSAVPQIFAISWGLVEPRTLCELYVFLISLVLGASFYTA